MESELIDQVDFYDMPFELPPSKLWVLAEQDDINVAQLAKQEKEAVNPTFLSRLEVYNQTIKEKGNRLSRETVLLMLDRWGNIEYSTGLKDNTQSTRIAELEARVAELEVALKQVSWLLKIRDIATKAFKNHEKI